MKFTYEELEEIQSKYNGLYDKCNSILGTIYHELRKILNEIKDSQMQTHVRWEFGNHLISIDDFTITKNGLDLGSEGIHVHLISDEFEDGEFEYIIPYEWLELEEFETDDLVKKSLRKEVNDFITIKEMKIKHINEEKEKDLINRIKDMDKERVVELLDKCGFFTIK